MVSSKPAQQGASDGLCGIYCLINFMRGWFENDSIKNDRESFRYLMQSAERLRILTSDRLYGGYECHELIEIFNTSAANLEKDFIAVSFNTLKTQLRRLNKTEKLEKIFNDNGQVVVSVDRHEHWVLATGIKGDEMAIIDSDPTSDRDSINVGDLARPFTGLTLLPNTASLLAGS